MKWETKEMKWELQEIKWENQETNEKPKKYNEKIRKINWVTRKWKERHSGLAIHQVNSSVKTITWALELTLVQSHLLCVFSTVNAIQFTVFVCSTRSASLLGGRDSVYGMRSLPDTSTHDWQWESNSWPFDLLQRPINYLILSPLP